ncbi:hypothetical protein ACOMHN_013977 [Nucella lapillus]
MITSPIPPPHTPSPPLSIHRIWSRNTEGKFFSSQLNDDVNELVQSHVQRHMKDDNVTYDEALMTTKHDVVEEKTRPEFFSKLVDIVGNKILPVLKSVLGKVAATAASVYCSVM